MQKNAEKIYAQKIKNKKSIHFCHKTPTTSYSIMKGFNIFYLGEMKLSEYFKYQQSQEMPAHLKSELFSRIQKEKNWIEISTKIPSRIFFFASKRIMYTSLAAILVFVVLDDYYSTRLM